MSVCYISRALFLCFFVVVVYFLFIAYATKSWEISQGLEIKNPSMW